jgi:hypothetical protein
VAATPESKVKARVHALLAERHAYAVNYIGGQYANNGTPDILACLDGRFIGIEVKAGRGKPTALQLRSLALVDAAGGLSLIINEKSLDYLRECLQDIHKAESNWHEFAKQRSDDD